MEWTGFYVHYRPSKFCVQFLKDNQQITHGLRILFCVLYCMIKILIFLILLNLSQWICTPDVAIIRGFPLTFYFIIVYGNYNRGQKNIQNSQG